MDTQAIKTFIQVANLGSFTRAAEELRYAQSTVTMQIQRLEEALGFPLFERIGRKSCLTPAGQNFLPKASQILRLLQEASSLGAEPSQLKGTLRIGVLESLLFAGVLPVLPDFRREFPHVDVSLKIGQASELLTQLKQNSLDMIYISGALQNDPALERCYQRREDLIFLAGPNHPLAGQERIPIRQVLTCPFIMAEPSGYCYGRLHEIAREQDIPLRHSVLVDNIAAISRLLGDDRSLAFLPEYALGQELEAGTLKKLSVDFPTQVYHSQLLLHRNKWVSPYMERFMELIRCLRPGDPQ